MIELFENVSATSKKRIQFMVDINFLCPDPRKAAKDLIDFRNLLETEEEKKFMDFYFSMCLVKIKGELKDEDSNDLR